MPGYVEGAALLLGVLLVSAGGMKLAAPRSFEHAVHRLLPGRREGETTMAKVAPYLVGAAELLCGGALLAAPGLPRWAAAAALVGGAALYVAFVPVVLLAVRKGAACGCWGSFSDGPAGGAEVGRAVVLAAAAAVAAAIALAAGTGERLSPAAAAWAAALGAAAIGAALLGRRLVPEDGPGTRSPAGARLRVTRLVAFFLGRVTSSKSQFPLPRIVRLRASERDRYVAAVRATPTVRALEAWLAQRGKAVAWNDVRARRQTMRGGGLAVRHVLLDPPQADGVSVTIAVRLDGVSPAEPTVTGTVDGVRLSARRGAVEVRGTTVER